ncbi:MAG: hypothetical protein AAF939_05005 [Planctomycetota bacterium]
MSLEQPSTRQRTQMITDVKTQGIIVRKTLLHWTIFTLSSLMISVIIQFCNNPFDTFSNNFVKAIRTFAPVMLTLICVGPIFIFDFLKLSNRIFGPIPRIRNKIRALAKGEFVSQLKTREDDTHLDLVEDINLLIQMIQVSRVPESPTEPATHAQIQPVASAMPQATTPPRPGCPSCSHTPAPSHEDRLISDLRNLLTQFQNAQVSQDASVNSSLSQEK